jgi:pyruvate/2-oxoacid:ferredoxin oxidoreductase beta subunit
MDPTDTVVFSYPESLSRLPTHYCPGCLHGVAHRLVAEAVDAFHSVKDVVVDFESSRIEHLIDASKLDCDIAP